jgi:hypothetical protein
LRFFHADPAKRQQKQAHWAKKSMLGIVAKLCIGHAGKAGLPPPAFLDRPLEAFVGILREKYRSNPELGAALLATRGRYLLEFSRFGARGWPPTETNWRAVEYWGGCLVDGRVHGHNLMGFCHVCAREALAAPAAAPGLAAPRLAAAPLAEEAKGAKKKEERGGETANEAGATADEADEAEAMAELLLSLGLVAP